MKIVIFYLFENRTSLEETQYFRSATNFILVKVRGYGDINGIFLSNQMNKKLTYLLALTFLFLFSGSVFGQEEVKKEYWDNGKLKRKN